MLPIQERKNEITKLVEENQVLILSSETGTGKTTQVPKYIYEMYKQPVVCSQPRRIAAISIAKRVAEEMGEHLGGLVGYSVRFEERVSEKTQVRYVTDGTLLRDFIDDPLVSKYKAVIIDEVHERTINIDLLLGVIKDAVALRPDLKVIIMSATMCTEKFLAYFPGSSTFHIESRSYPIAVKYVPSTEKDYLEHCIASVAEIHTQEPEGDILVFLTGEDEIEKACRAVELMKSRLGEKPLLPLLLYASLPLHMQNAIFTPTAERKVIFATNIAETSITIESIVYVVDSGFAKQKIFDSGMKSEMLLRLPISKSSANQRKGRAGRVRAGVCYRMYTEDIYNSMEEFTIPEILRGELSSLVLKMARLEIKNLVTFDFIEPPLPDSVIVALNQLYFLGAIDINGHITEEGRLLVEFPLEPKDAKTLLEGARYNVVEATATLAAMTGNMIYDKYKFDLAIPESDHLTYYMMMKDYEKADNRQRFCYQHGLNAKNMENVLKSKKQILKIIDHLQNKLSMHPEASKMQVEERIERAILSGYLLQTAKVYTESKALLSGTGADVKVTRLYKPDKPKRRRGSQRVDPQWITYRELTKQDGKYILRMVSNLVTPSLDKLAEQHKQTLHAIKFSLARL
ncbi:pre-mRNA-splicing factor ATP-dependent RNA helicase DHX16 [Nematocida sp. AWRm77]|nr:pre-mRNA-splicing factor ATP-dependent RNA helicase DHX16 [Nematocida sp. AWRm77]